MKYMKRSIAWLLVFCLAVSFLSIGAFAEDEVLDIEAPAEEIGEEIQAETITGTTETYDMTLATAPADGTVTLSDSYASPFVYGVAGSNSYRIPAMVTLSDGTLVAAADARWNCTYDGGGADTLVARSTDNGATWSYSFANYLGDNGNSYSGSSSTAFLDPSLAVDSDDNIYMLVDLYPYGIALNGSGNTAPSTAVGFTDAGYLKLSTDGSNYTYYLKDGKIYNSSNTEVSGYTVDGKFNIYQNGTYVSNLFFSDSPYKVVRTGYLYLTKSTDKGQTWSDPTLISGVKTSSEQVCLIAPGNSVVLSDGTIIFPVYSYNGSDSSQRAGFIYSTDNGATWTRCNSSSSSTGTWSSESAIVEVSSTLLRVFYRNDTGYMKYVDVTKNSDGTYTWGSVVDTGIGCTSNTEISAIKVTYGGTDYILVSCPGNPTTGHSGSDRCNGKIFTFKASDMTKVQELAVPSVHDTTANSFMYSSMSLLKDNAGVAILYEDQENAWGYGSTCYYQMSFKTYTFEDLGISGNFTDTITDETTGTSVTASDGTLLKTVSVAAAGEVTGVSGNYVAYEVTLNSGSYTGEGTVTLPLSDTLKAAGSLVGFVVNSDSSITYYPGTKTADGKFTFTSGHFSTVGVTDTITVASGGTAQLIPDGTVTTVSSADETIATAALSDSSEGTYTKVSSITSGKKYILAFGTNAIVTSTYSSSGYNSSWTSAKGLYAVTGTVSSNDITATGIADYTWTITSQNDGTYTIQNNAGKYLNIVGQNDVELSDTETYVAITNSSGSFTITNAGGTMGLNNFGGNNVFASGWSTATSMTFYQENTTSAVVITGVSRGSTTITVGTQTYNVTVSAAMAAQSIALGSNTTTITVGTLNAGETIQWASSDPSIVGVFGDTTGSATLYGSSVGTASVTATVTDADGNQTAYTWSVTVTDADNTTSRYIYLYINKIQNCTVYYAINGGELIQVPGDGQVLIDNSSVQGHFQISFFAAPDEGSALTYMASTNSSTQYYCLSDGTADDGTDSSAWPFVSTYDWATNGASTTGSDSTVYNTSNGYRWGLAEGNITALQLQDLYKRALALGCDGTLVFTKNKQGTTTKVYSASATDGTQNNLVSDLDFVAQPIATVAKEIVSVKDSSGTSKGTGEGNLGDTVTYKITVTVPQQDSTYGTITYTDTASSLVDTLTGSQYYSDEACTTAAAYTLLSTLDDLTTTAHTFTYYTKFNVTTAGLKTALAGGYLADGVLSNTVKLDYSYASTYSTGTTTETAKAAAPLAVSTPDYVVDFGQPVTVSLSEILGEDTIESGTASYGTITASGTSFTYTPSQVLRTKDQVTLILTSGTRYCMDIYPATTVYYDSTYADLSGSGVVAATANTGTQQAAQAGAVAAGTAYVYGYDASNSTYTTATELKTKGDSAAYEFTGTGTDLYINSTASSGTMMIGLYQVDTTTDPETKTLKRLTFIDTTSNNSLYAETTINGAIFSGSNEYGLTAYSLTDLTYGTYMVKITNVSTDSAKSSVYFAGFRVYETLASESAADAGYETYYSDLEEDPTFLELRDQVLGAYGVSSYAGDYAAQIASNAGSQIYSSTGAGNGTAIVLSPDVLEAGSSAVTNLSDLISNGPKNELFLLPGQQLTFIVSTTRKVQIGLHSVSGSVQCSLNGGDDITINNTIDMFYELLSNTSAASRSQTVTITNDGEDGVLAVTKLKVSDDPSFTLEPLTQEDITGAVENFLGIDESAVRAEGWNQIDGQWYFYENSTPKTGWLEDGGSTYYLREDGSMFTGWLQENGTWYYFNEDGILTTRTGWQEIEGSWYYFSKSGKVTTGWKTISKHRYYFDADGVMATGLRTISKKTYYFGEDGIMQTGLQTIDGVKYYFNSNGTQFTGWKSISRKWYYFTADGAVQNDWAKISKKWYYFDAAGVMLTGWQQIDGSWYYLSSSGAMKTGLQTIGKNRYYFDSNGVMQTGWQQIGKKWYCFGDDGVMLKGWQTIDGTRYYFSSSGVMQTGTVKISGKKYTFDSNGALK